MRRSARPARHRADRSRPRFDLLEPRSLRALAGGSGLESLGDLPGSVAAEQSPDATQSPLPGSSGFDSPSDPGGFGDGGFGDGGFGDGGFGDGGFGDGGFGDGGWGDPPPISSTPLQVLATDPTSGTVLTTPLRSLTVTFDRPLDPTTLTSRADILLDRVAEDGRRTRLVASTVALGPLGDQVVFTLGQGLAPGRYQVKLWGGTSLRGVDGALMAGDGSDQILSDFRVEDGGVGLGDAIDLGTIGPVPTSAQGDLDFRADPNQVRLYRISLPEGHFWRLGLEVTAERDGGALDSALALFDAQGRPIAIAEGGRSDAPKDPYLFAGLEAGTYYIGVSGTGDLPGSPAGYDPSTATAGAISQTQAGGAYTLHAVADPADQPISLVSFGLDRADPLAPDVTGITLGFSGAIRLDNPVGDLLDDLSGGIEVVDQRGQIWPVAALDYDESAARVSYIFRDRLPEGRYTVRLPRSGGLVDLAGHVPASAGLPSGVLGEFSEGPDDADRDAHDLGPLMPDPAVAGVSVATTLDAGESTTYRFVIIFPGMYTFQGRYGGGPLAIRLAGPGGDLPIAAIAPDADDGTNDTYLEEGVYEIRLTAPRTGPLQALVTIKSPSTGPESITLNGVGQGPGLGLRLINPPVPDAPVPDAPVPDPPVPPPPASAPPPPPASPPQPPTPEPPAPFQVPAPSQPMPRPGNQDVSPALPPAITTSGIANPPPAIAPRQTPQGLFFGLGGDLLGRPVVADREAPAPGPGVEAKGIDLTRGDGGLRRGYGQGPTSGGGGLSAGRDRPWAGFAAPAGLGKDEGSRVGGVATEAPSAASRWLVRPIAAVIPEIEPRPEVIRRDEPAGIPPLAAGVPPDQPPADLPTEQARVDSAADTTLAVVVIGHAFRRLYRWMDRKFVQPDRKSRRIDPGRSPLLGGRG